MKSTQQFLEEEAAAAAERRETNNSIVAAALRHFDAKRESGVSGADDKAARKSNATGTIRGIEDVSAASLPTGSLPITMSQN